MDRSNSVRDIEGWAFWGLLSLSRIGMSAILTSCKDFLVVVVVIMVVVVGLFVVVVVVVVGGKVAKESLNF